MDLVYLNAKETFINLGKIDDNPYQKDTQEFNLWNHYFEGFMNWLFISSYNMIPI